MATDRYLQWLIAEIGFQTSYHNHKETMAWVATAFYIPGIIVLGFYTQKMLGITSCWRCLFVFVVFVLFGIVAAFVYEQFRLRSHAADTVAALMKLVNDLSKDEDYQKSIQGKLEIKQKDLWPEFRSITTKLFTDVTSYAAIVLATFIAIYLVCLNLQ